MMATFSRGSAWYRRPAVYAARLRARRHGRSLATRRLREETDGLPVTGFGS